MLQENFSHFKNEISFFVAKIKCLVKPTQIAYWYIIVRF